MKKRTTKEIWDALTGLYEAKSLRNKILLNRRLYTLLMSEPISITDHINNSNTLFSQLVALDYNTKENEHAKLQLKSLYDSCNHLTIDLTGNVDIKENEHAELQLQNLHDSYDRLITNLTSNVLIKFINLNDVESTVI